MYELNFLQNVIQTQTEPHTDAKYNVSWIDTKFISSLHEPGITSDLSAHQKENPFLVKESKVKTGRGHEWKYPQKIDSVENFSECWFKGGSKHNELKGYISLHLMTSIPNESAMSS